VTQSLGSPYLASGWRLSQDMTTRSSTKAEAFGAMERPEKLECLRGLSELVWDIEEELAQARAARAALMTSLQQDLRQEAS
jgi:hypothetical protein